MSGKLIVFEGTDGSGKATQSKLLFERLRARGVDCRKLNFPRYGEKSAALVELYLGGAFGTHPNDVNAYAASTFYSVDRYASYKQDWGKYYEAGGLLIADRYTTSNAVHQAGKLPDGEREKYLDWLLRHFEYGLLGLPEPSLVFYLDVPTELTEKMMREREQATNTKADIHEQDEAYLRACRENAKKVAERCSWQRIDCSKGRRDAHGRRHTRGNLPPRDGTFEGLTTSKTSEKGRSRAPSSQEESALAAAIVAAAAAAVVVAAATAVAAVAAPAAAEQHQNDDEDQPHAAIVVIAHFRFTSLGHALSYARARKGEPDR